MTKPIHCIDDARDYASRRLPRIMFDYVDGAAGAEIANQLNQDRIAQLRLMPRVLVNVDERDLSTQFLGREWNLPFGIAPMGMCNLTWPGADRMLADAAKRFNIPMTLSTMSSTSLEQVADWTKDNGWFQLYVGQSETQAMQLVQRAEDSGYSTLMLTVDVPQVAPRIRDLKNGFKAPLRIGPRQFLDFACHPKWSLSTLFAGAPALANFAPGEFDRDAGRGLVDWNFLDRLRHRWKGHLVVKGVLS
ncbi:MAG: alpha-hydroxy acid oxidase, partial [bacterium]